MNIASKIACRTIGTLGMSACLYDAFKVGGHYSRSFAEDNQANYLEKLYFNSRTTNSVSYLSNEMRKGTANFLSKSPIPTLWGKIKGGIYGFLSGLGTWLPAIGCSALALTGKGRWAKAGTAGTALCFLYSAVTNGLGIGKQHPMK